MSLSTSLQAYEDCIEVFDAALENSKGVKVKMLDEDAAYFFRMRMHQARGLIKKNNRRIYEDDHPMYGASEYDKLVVRMKKINGNHFIFVEHWGADRGEIEPIDGAEDVAEQVLETTENVKQVVVQRIARRI